MKILVSVMILAGVFFIMVSRNTEKTPPSLSHANDPINLRDFEHASKDDSNKASTFRRPIGKKSTDATDTPPPPSSESQNTAELRKLLPEFPRAFQNFLDRGLLLQAAQLFLEKIMTLSKDPSVAKITEYREILRQHPDLWSQNLKISELYLSLGIVTDEYLELALQIKKHFPEEYEERIDCYRLHIMPPRFPARLRTALACIENSHNQEHIRTAVSAYTHEIALASGLKAAKEKYRELRQRLSFLGDGESLFYLLESQLKKISKPNNTDD